MYLLPPDTGEEEIMMTKKKVPVVLAKILGVFFLFLACVLLRPAPAFAAVPDLDAEITARNVLSLLKAYDTDGYYLVKEGNNYKGNYMAWFSENERIVDRIGTAVHEQCHRCMHATYAWEQLYYRGNKKYFTVDWTEVFGTKEIAASVPKACRVFRYKTYVSEASSNSCSNINGVYGLLNEFTAYCWEMNNCNKLFAYYEQFPATMDTWYRYINDGANGRQAYSEFKSFILHYLYYAQKKHPAIYRGIMKNKSFRTAFKYLDAKFRKNILQYNANLKKILKLMKAAKHNAYIDEDGNFFSDDGGTSLFQKEYKAILKVTKQAKYQKIYEKLLA